MNRDEVERLEELKERIGRDLQDLENMLQRDKNLRDIWHKDKMRIWFPGGVIRTVESVKERIPFLEIDDNEVLAANIAYLWQWVDVLEWFLFRFNLDFSAASMACNMGIVTYAHIAAAVSTGFIRWYKKKVDSEANPPKDFKSSIRFIAKRAFRELDKIGFDIKGLKQNIEDLWDLRNDIHIEDLKRVAVKEYTNKEYGQKYDRKKLIKIQQTVNRLLEALNMFYHLNKEREVTHGI